MLVLILGNLPLPLILYLNLRITIKFWRIHKLTRHAKIPKPPKLIVGWLMSNAAVIFVLIPILSERTFFVQDIRWLGSFAIAAALTIGGLLLEDSALAEELKEFEKTGHLQNRR
jgi:hypothetical protein